MVNPKVKSLTLQLPIEEWRDLQLKAARAKVSLNNYVRSVLFPEAVIAESKAVALRVIENVKR